MTQVDIAPSQVKGHPVQHLEKNYINNTSGISSWLLTLDHKRIGLMYLVGISLSFFLGGLFALAIRLELFAPGMQFMDAATYNKVFTLHGAVMVFLFIIPGIPAALGNVVLPLMLGAKDVAFPRLNLSSFYLWLGGATFFLYTLFDKQLDTGWTFYTPYSSSYSDTSVISATFGVFLLGFSSIFTGLNFLVTIHKMRPPGMTWHKLPLFLWGMYGTAIMQLLATPVLGITLLLLVMETTLGIGIFDPKKGGDPVLYQHFFWFYSHPAVYIMILPAMAVVSEIIATFSRKHIFGYKMIAYSSVSIALLSFLVWGHHMFVSSESTLATLIFSAITFTIAIPSAIKVFNWLATLYKGSVSLGTPMLYALEFIWLFTIGGLTGLFLGVLSTDVMLHDTYFVVAHFHYVMVGGTLFAFFAGLHYWWPKMTGKMYSEALGRTASVIAFIGFNLAFFPQFIMGSRGMPRRYADYKPDFELYHQLSTVGTLVLGVGIALITYNLIRSIFSGKNAPANPWGSATIEWECPSPPPYYNFEHPPLATDPYDMERVEWNDEVGGYIPVVGRRAPASH
ncbi:MAG: cytochrome c oxidase subunit 1 [Paracoccaceae bacterium]|jgi:cytochrome c oxidase subunit 1